MAEITSRMPISYGVMCVVLACAVNVILALLYVGHLNAITISSLTASTTAFVAMACSQFIATRAPGVDWAFGGLDRSYRVHRAIGILVAGLIVVHFWVAPDFRAPTFKRLNDFANWCGTVAFYGLLALIAISVFKRLPRIRGEIPYHWWRHAHRVAGLLFILVAIHQTFIKPPFEPTSLYASYLNAFALLGVLSFLYTQLRRGRRQRRYRAVAIERLPAATLIEVEPEGRPLTPRPGQFAFLSVEKRSLREPHPFTIAGTEPGGRLRFAIKPCGDFTERLRDELREGDFLSVEGGYGQFNYLKGGDKQIWLAGGIGVTPFLAMAQNLGTDLNRRIHLIHCVRRTDEAIGQSLLEAKARDVPYFTFETYVSDDVGRLDAAKLINICPIDPGQADLWFCGPSGLRIGITKGLDELGRRPRRVEFERFEFR